MTIAEQIEMLTRQLVRLEEMSKTTTYAKALAGLTDTMLDVMATIRSLESELE